MIILDQKEQQALTLVTRFRSTQNDHINYIQWASGFEAAAGRPPTIRDAFDAGRVHQAQSQRFKVWVQPQIESDQQVFYVYADDVYARPDTATADSEEGRRMVDVADTQERADADVADWTLFLNGPPHGPNDRVTP